MTERVHMPTADLAINRRRFERFHTLPMYSPIEVTTLGHASRTFEGHAYDLSEGGMRFELDEAIPLGSAVTVAITLPRWLPARLDAIEDEIDQPNVVRVLGRVIWADDDGVPGPVRMAVEFTGFLDAIDRDRLMDTLAARALRRAA